MILSREKRFLFLKTTKVAGTTVELALSRLCGQSDVITPLLPDEEALRKKLGYPGPQNFEKPLRHYTAMESLRRMARGRRPPPLYFNHMRAAQVCQQLGTDEFEQLFKFSIVRNPYDYIVSKYFWKIRKRPGVTFREYLISDPSALLKNRRITHANGRNVTNVMLRYEHLRDDIRRYSERLGLDRRFFEDLQSIRLKGTARPLKASVVEVFQTFPEGIDLVRLICREEIETYGYDIPRI